MSSGMVLPITYIIDRLYLNNFHYLLLFYSTEMTIIGRDTEASTNVGHCTDTGCYKKPIEYKASLKLQLQTVTNCSLEGSRVDAQQ